MPEQTGNGEAGITASFRHHQLQLRDRAARGSRYRPKRAGEEDGADGSAQVAA